MKGIWISRIKPNGLLTMLLLLQLIVQKNKQKLNVECRMQCNTSFFYLTNYNLELGLSNNVYCLALKYQIFSSHYLLICCNLVALILSF